MWVTRTGRTLSPEGGAYWEHLYRTGHTDGLGHMRAPSVVQQPPKPAYDLTHVAKAQQVTQPKKPSFDTAVKAMHGDKAAQAELARWGKHKRGEREGALSAQQARDVGLFGAGLPAVQSAYPVVNPVAGAIIQSLSPTTAALDAFHAARRGAIPEAGFAALGLLPFPIGKGARAAKAAVDAGEAARAAEGAITPEAKVLSALKGAKETYAEQAALRSEELAKRIQRAGHAGELAGGGKEGVKAALGELKGKLPHLRWDALTHLKEDEVEHLIRSVDAHPGLEFFDNLNAKLALWKAADGEVLTPSEQKLIEHVFGEDAGKQVAKATPLSTQALRAGGELLNVPRSILSSFDVSGVLRQGLVATIHHPGIAAKNMGPMFKMLVNEKYYQDIMQAIEHRPNADFYHKAGLSLTELGAMGKREEGFMSNLAEKIPLLGRVVRGSGRSYTGFLNLMRADIFDTFLEGAVAAGRPNTPELRRQIARQVNVWTGRGGLGKYGEKAAVPLNTVFFSPRLFASRVQTFSTPFYRELDPYVRKQAALAATKLVASGSTVLLLAWLAGAKVGLDPRSSDFGKIRVGNTRFDIWGGHQQIAKLIAQLSTGTIISSTTGKTLHVGNQFGDMTKPEIAFRFARGKFSPGTSLIYDWFSGTDYQGKPFSWKKAALKNSFPLILGDLYDIQHQTGNPLYAAGAFIPGAFGIGVQTYGPNKPKSRDPFASIYTGGGKSSDPFSSLYTGP